MAKKKVTGTGGELLMHQLVAQGVEYAFTNTGSAEAGFFDAFLTVPGVQPVLLTRPYIDSVPEPNDTILSAGAALISAIAAIVSYRSDKIHGFATEVSVELSKVTWPSRQETWSQTIVVLIVSAIAAAILGVFDSAWSWITDMIYDV